MNEAERLRNYFYGWQCRIRQHAVRNEDGRPSQGMLATLSVKSGESAGPFVTGLVKQDASQITAEFRHIVKKTHDPNLRQQSAIKLLSSVYYQYPKEFADYLTTTHAADSELADQLVELGACELLFEQYQQQFTLVCSVEKLAIETDAYQTTYWHNRMFNPVMPATITVLSFIPDWDLCSATPEVT